jgi:ATP-dependent HslUV protease subunit HslV
MQPIIHATTVIGIHHNGMIALGADGQATMGNTIAKNNVRKVRVMLNGQVMAGFAGSTADAFALLERFEAKLNAYPSNMKRAAIELAKDWRMDKYLQKLEAMLVVADKESLLIISGSGDVLEPENGIAAIGSGSNYALSAALALKKFAPQLTAEEMVRESLTVAADICIYTNHNFVIEKITSNS